MIRTRLPIRQANQATPLLRRPRLLRPQRRLLPSCIRLRPCMKIITAPTPPPRLRL